MFTRIVELNTKPGKSRELSDTINDKVLPILKKQKGFVDETVLIADKEANRVLGLSFWKTKEDGMQERIGPILAPRVLPAPTHTFRNCARVTSNPEVICSSVGLVPTDALVSGPSQR
jgi:hypothetical protein